VNPAIVVVMGVSGCGKSTVGKRLADAMAVRFVEGDELHSPHNVALMAAGTPLTDGNRADWLRHVAQRLTEAAGEGQGLVISCSALKRSYREQLRAAAPALHFIYLQGNRALLAERLQSRAGHYMPPSMLQSQLDTLEPPAPDEHAITLDIADTPDALVAEARRQLEGSA